MTRILAIESSCDETSVAVVEDGRHILSNVVASQIQSHMRFGGVVPEIASRHHVEQITQVYQMALEDAGVTIDQIDAVAVTVGPGLIGALLAGTTAAKTLAFIHDKPLIAVNHLAGHIYAGQLVQPFEYPLLGLVVSGGHTELAYMRSPHEFEIIGETHDDAVGEAYDKIGRMIGLPYPAGKAMDDLAHVGQATYDVPRAMIHEDNLDFSFSGMKSAVMNLIHNARQRGEEIRPADIAASFQDAAVEVLVTKTLRAVERYPDVKQFVLGGGVSANKQLRDTMTQVFAEQHPDITLIIPPLSLTGDNAAMIGAAADYLYHEKIFAPLDVKADPSLML